MKKQIKFIIVIVLGLVILGGIGFLAYDYLGKKSDGNENREVVLSPQVKFEQKLSNFYDNDNQDLQNSIDLIKSGDIKGAITILEKLLNDNTFSGDDLDGLKSLLVSSYLTQGSVYYQESENAGKARELLNSPSFSKETWFYNYYMGYSYEIESSFEQARAFYNEALKYGGNIKKGQSLNQIGHVLDLEGNIEEAARYYKRAYSYDDINIQTNLNLGRYYSRKMEFDKATDYFKFVIDNTDNKILKSEIYYNLSTIAFFSEPDLDISINYAIDSIELNPQYPLGYVAKSRGLIEKGETGLDTKDSLDKAVSIYQDLSSAHKYLGIYYYLNQDFENAINSFNDYIKTTNTDITLMNNQRKLNKNEGQYFLTRSYALNGNVDKSMDTLLSIIEEQPDRYISQFLGDLSVENGPFDSIKDNDKLKDTLEIILEKYTINN